MKHPEEVAMEKKQIMIHQNKIVLIALAILMLYGCRKPLQQTDWPEYQKINTGFGPEDMVIDSISAIKGILISTSSRRPEYGEYGEIEKLVPGKNNSYILKRVDEPANLVFHPHGLNITKENGKPCLYVISHDDANNHHFIVKYKIDNDRLIFEKLYESPLLISPNALHAFDDGRLLVCNDARKRNALYEKILKLKTSNIVYLDENENWKILADKIGYAAGLEYSDAKVYVSAALENKVYRFHFDGNRLSDKTILTKINGPDNIRFYKDKLIIAAHYNPMAFIKHVNNKEKHSPSTVFSIDKTEGQTKLLYANDGKVISASSTGVIYHNKLFINQIFEPWIIEIPLSESIIP